ncbi:hypothetical protein HZB07_01035 [Candidatus Saganbacteria bacterium]|nr:hypothetical protein [Candidatus Saganbacteria bacterium]
MLSQFGMISNELGISQNIYNVLLITLLIFCGILLIISLITRSIGKFMGMLILAFISYWISSGTLIAVLLCAISGFFYLDNLGGFLSEKSLGKKKNNSDIKQGPNC